MTFPLVQRCIATTIDKTLCDSITSSSVYFFSYPSNRSSSEAIKVGFALVYHIYSTWKGKSLFLEDLYVKTEYRNRGIGRRLFTRVCRWATETGCCRVDFHVVTWNPALKFYEAMGATNMTTHFFYRTAGDALNALSAQDD